MLKTIGKAMLWITVSFLLLFGALALLVRHYLTEENVRALLVPAAQDLLGRKVEMGAIDIGLLRGIEIRDVAVKEADGVNDFANISSLSLSYDILALFHRRLALSEITIDRPVVSIARDASGRFNFEGIGPGQSASLAPIALTVDRVAVLDARVTVRDATGRIPDTDLSAGLDAHLTLGKGVSGILYEGTYRLDAEMRLGEISPRISATGSFDNERIRCNAVLKTGGESARLTGEATGYRQAPVVRLDVEALALELDRLLAAAALLTRTEGAEKAASGQQPGKGTGSGKTDPSGPVAYGTVRIGQAKYHGLALDDLALTWRLEKDVVTVSDFSAAVAGGKVLGSGRADMGVADLAWSGDADMEQVDISAILAPFAPEQAQRLSGCLTSHAHFSGAGTAWAHIRKTLAARATYLVEGARLSWFPANEAVSNLLGSPELRDLSFEKIEGNLSISNGQILVSSVMSGSEIRAEANGTIGLNGTLDLPIVLSFSHNISEKLSSQTGLARLLTAKEGNTVVRFRLTGTLDRPTPVLDPGFFRERALETFQKALENAPDSGRGLPPARRPRDAVKGILEGILGR